MQFHSLNLYFYVCFDMFKIESSFFFFFWMFNLISEALRESKREMNNATRGNIHVSLLNLVLNFYCYHHRQKHHYYYLYFSVI